MSRSCRGVCLVLVAAAVAGASSGCGDKGANAAKKFDGTIPKSGAAVVTLHMALT